MSPLGPADHPVTQAALSPSPLSEMNGVEFVSTIMKVGLGLGYCERGKDGMKRSHGSETLIPTCLGGSREHKS